MENIEEDISEHIKKELITKKIYEKISNIGFRTYEIKRMEGIIFHELCQRPNGTKEEKKETRRMKVIAFEGFWRRWEQINQEKDEVDGMIRALYDMAETEKENWIRGIENTESKDGGHTKTT